jgi:alpha-glucosidase
VVRRKGTNVSLKATVDGDGFSQFRRQAFRVVLHGYPSGDVMINGARKSVENGELVIDNRGESFELGVQL